MTDDTPLDFFMTDLDEQLHGPQAKEVKADLLRRLGEIDLALTLEMAEAPPPELFQKIQIIRKAVAAAENLVLQFP